MQKINNIILEDIKNYRQSFEMFLKIVFNQRKFLTRSLFNLSRTNIDGSIFYKNNKNLSFQFTNFKGKK